MVVHCLIPRQGRKKRGLVSAHPQPLLAQKLVGNFRYIISQFLNEIHLLQVGNADGQSVAALTSCS